MIITIKSRRGGVLYETEAACLREAVEKAVAQGVSLAGADLRGGDFKKGRFGGIDLRAGDLRNADFSGAIMPGARLGAANCAGAKFIGADLNNANFDKAELTKTDFSEANLNKAKLSGVSASKVVMEKAVLVDAQVDGAMFAEAKFAGADVTGVVFDGVNLRGAEFKEFEVKDPNGAVRLAAVQGMYDACEALQQAYLNGERRGGSIEWGELDDAHDDAKKALKEYKAEMSSVGNPGEAMVPRAVADDLHAACTALCTAYSNGRSNGGSIVLGDLDDAHELADKAIGRFLAVAPRTAPLPEHGSADRHRTK